ncbi:MAG: hypothetical protein ACRDVE_08935, partial [Actinocrinis sp.]
LGQSDRLDQRLGYKVGCHAVQRRDYGSVLQKICDGLKYSRSAALQGMGGESSAPLLTRDVS